MFVFFCTTPYIPWTSDFCSCTFKNFVCLEAWQFFPIVPNNIPDVFKAFIWQKEEKRHKKKRKISIPLVGVLGKIFFFKKPHNIMFYWKVS